MKQKIGIIGAGFAGLSASCYLSKFGFDVTVIEKNDQVGGRARTFEHEGFKFDMGPSWYWMPDIFEKFFEDFQKSVSNFYELERLNPSYRMVISAVSNPKDLVDYIDIPSDLQELKNLFESIETGSALNLEKYLADAKFKYELGIYDYAKRPSISLFEYMDFKLIYESFKSKLFSSFAKHIRKYFKNPLIIKILEFPVLFLGATPVNTPSMYSLMNYADLSLGTWYPKGGFSSVSNGMAKLSKELGTNILLNNNVQEIKINKNDSLTIITNNDELSFDIVVGACDYAHAEQTLLPLQSRQYNENYWDSRILAPSCILFYLGMKCKIPNLLHHTLFFDEDFGVHANEIYEQNIFPTKPLFYVSATSKTDKSVAPDNSENLFILIPVPSSNLTKEKLKQNYEKDLEKTEQLFDYVIKKLSAFTGIENFPEQIIFKRSYCVYDFIEDYNSLRGNAYGLANTLFQTGYMKPKIKSSKVKNLYFAGQLTVPGPGVPTCIISGEIVSKLIRKENP